jgi:hypothetical protein
MQAWNRPPLPNASPEPANVTVTGPVPGELTGPPSVNNVEVP